MEFTDICIEMVQVPAGSPQAGKALADLDLIRRLGIQIGGIKRNGHRMAVPSGAEKLLELDLVLVLGTHEQILEFRSFLKPL